MGGEDLQKETESACKGQESIRIRPGMNSENFLRFVSVVARSVEWFVCLGLGLRLRVRAQA